MLICSDFDGTINIPKSPSVLTQNLQAIQNWRAAGHYFAIITGRNHATIDHILPGWKNLVDYIIFDNGGAIFSHHDQLICINELDPQISESIQDFVRGQAVAISYSAYCNAFALPTNEATIKLRLYCYTEEKLWDLQQTLETQNWPIKVLPWPKRGFSNLPDGTDVSQFFGFLDIVPANSGKECNIIQLVERELPQIPFTDIITIGDDYNDITMLSQFQGYAISGSPNQVIAAAKGRNTASVATLISQILRSVPSTS